MNAGGTGSSETVFFRAYWCLHKRTIPKGRLPVWVDTVAKVENRTTRKISRKL